VSIGTTKTKWIDGSQTSIPRQWLVNNLNNKE
jgi:hypothetical protein